ncbi:hypothetical protein BZG36_00857 [Bifiguratus adelaidae]|uniref:Far11/STRP C-terminal domain-containing protein n=1 Tax=Bifiguratus adelaidae TaxID=1938954 RepID=A0A261Y5D0_9FUNG|nr:hypothetical protein BZG36_00857 [Bifiguratus adelaidae]
MSDALTASQLKHLAQLALASQDHEDIEYRDTSKLQAELDEFLDYAELPVLYASALEFQAETPSNESPHEKVARYKQLLDQLNATNLDQRSHALRQLAYIAQGSFSISNSSQVVDDTCETVVKSMLENTTALLEAGGVTSCYECLKRALKQHDQQCQLNPLSPSLSVINTEISQLITILYMMTESARVRNESLERHLENMSPTPIVLCLEAVSQLREKNVKTFPVRKLLHLTWKLLLTTIGGEKQLQEAKSATDALCVQSGTKVPVDRKPETKVGPQELYMFETETRRKYPSFVPNPLSTPLPNPSFFKAIPQNQLSGDAMSNFLQTDATPAIARRPANNQNQTADTANIPNANGRRPSQSSQRTPFVLPLDLDGPLVPSSIDEASLLYAENLYMSRSNRQLFQERENFQNWVHSGRDRSISDIINITLMDIDRIEVLKLVDDLYESILPNLQNITIVLLKLLLSTVANNSNNSATANSTNTGTTQPQLKTYSRQPLNGLEAPEPYPFSDKLPKTAVLEEADTARNREIMSKVISAILLLLMRWFKRSHVLKFEYFSQLLIDSGCLLLILKILGLQDINTSLTSSKDVEEWNFTKFVSSLPHAVNATTTDNTIPTTADRDNQPTDPSSNTTEQTTQSSSQTKNGRNLFWTINFVRILQKLTKRKTHRILLLVQYKSSAILKRILKVSQRDLELYTLKVLKSQVAFLGKKWRTSNMRIITAIYLQCKQGLRDDWVTGNDMDTDLEDAMAQEQSLRTLIRFYHQRRYQHLVGKLFPAAKNAPTNQLFADVEASISMPWTDDETSIVFDEIFREDYEQWLEEEVFSDVSDDEPILDDNTMDSAWLDGESYARLGWETPFEPGTIRPPDSLR